MKHENSRSNRDINGSSNDLCGNRSSRAGNGLSRIIKWNSWFGPGKKITACAVLFLSLLLSLTFGRNIKDIYDIFSDEIFCKSTVEASADTFFAYAYSKSGDSLTVDSAEELVSAAASYPVTIKGTINTSKYVIVENGTPRITNKSVFSSGYPQIFIYIPEITIDKAYDDMKDDVNDLVRLVDSPVSGWKLRTDYDITKGTHTGLTLSLFPEYADASAEVSTAALKMQIWDGTAWQDIWMPDGSQYNITEVIKDEPDPDISKCAGLKATVSDCSINGITGQVLADDDGLTVTVTGAELVYNSRHKLHDQTGWFTNLPEGLMTAVREDSIKDPSSVKIIFAKSKKNSFYTVTPAEASTDPVRIAIPLAELTVSEGECPWNEIAGEVVVNLNQNAVYNILTPGQFIASGKPMIVSAAVTGVFGQKTIGGNVTYLPIKEYSDTTTVYVPGSMVETNETTGKTYVPVTLTAAEGDFVIDGTPVTDIEIISSEAKEIDDDIYRVLIEIPSKKMCATKVTSGRFGVKAGNVTADPKNTYVSYEIYESASELPDEPDPVTEDDENDDELPTGTAPDIWVNGKDIKKEDYYKKTMTKAAASLINSVPDGCKLVTSVTDTTVEDASAAFPSGKGKKSNTAKAAYKKADDAVVVTAGKTEGTVRVWLAAVDKQKKVQASGYFDVTVGIAPKKVYVTKEKDAAVTAAVKSIALNVGDSVKLYANAAGTELSPFSGFTWYTVADTVPLEIERAKNTRSATLKATAVTDTGKVLKIPVILENDESRKRVKFTILVENRIKSITGLSDSLTLDSAVEAAVEKKLDYVPVCVSSNPTTDKIKVYTTAALEEGTGYSNNGKKFSLSSKSKVKVTYKNGEFTLKVPKKTVDGTKCRVLVVVTHGDKTVDVFESGVITIGKQNN